MNYVVEVEGPGTSRGATQSAASVCGGWVPEDQFGTAGVKWRGGDHP